MSLNVTVTGTPIYEGIPPSSISAQMRADDGDAGFGGFLIDDPDATVTTTGHKLVIVEESECSQPRLFTGYLTERQLSRSEDRALVAGSNTRLHDVGAVDLNAVFNFRIITTTGGKRPVETMGERLTWLLGYQALSVFVEDTGYVEYYSQEMDEADYTGATPAAVLDDLVGRLPDPILTYFAFWDPVAAAVGLYFGPESTGIGESSLSISNDLADIDGTTIFAPDAEAKLRRTPEGVYSEVIVEYLHGTKRVYRKRPETATTYVARGTTIQRPYTGRATTAQNQGDRWLSKHSYEQDEITVAIVVPPESAGLALAGQRIDVKFTHLPDYETWTSMRIVTSTVTPLDDTATQYRVELVLRLPVASAGPCGCGATVELVQSKSVGADDTAMSNPQSLTLDSAPTCGNLLVMVIYARDIHADLSTSFVEVDGFTKIEESWIDLGDTPRAKYLSVWARVVESGDGATWEAAQPLESGVLAWGTSGAIFLAEYSGVRIDSGTPAVVMRENDLTPALPDFTPATTQEVLLTAAIFWQPGEGQTPSGYTSVYDSGDPGPGDRMRMAFYTKSVASPSGSYTAEMSGLTDPTTDTHIIHFGMAACADEEEDLAQTPTSPVVTTTAPTVNDDANDGYTVGQTWIDTSTGATYTLVDATVGAAVWQLTSGAGISETLIDAKGDLIVGTAADTAARLAVGGTNGHVLTVDSAETAGMKWAAVSATGGGLLFPIDDRTLNATYGDHFDGSSLSAIWTRRNYTSGAETYQVGEDASYLRITAAGRAVGDGYYQTAPAGSAYNVEMKYVPRFYGNNYPNWGPAIIDSSGNGVVAFAYNAPAAIILAKVTTYSTYGSAYVRVGGSQDNIAQFGGTPASQERPIWLRLRKDGDDYYVNYSLDGVAWGIESNALTYAITVDRVGMIHAPIGLAVVNATIANRMDVDWFDVV